MNVMIIFNIVIMGFGIYMVAAALKMKNTGEINSAVITEEEIAKCKDKKAFIEFIYWREAVFGVMVVIVGALGLVDDLIVSLGSFNFIEMIVFLLGFIWFQSGLRKAREKFL